MMMETNVPQEQSGCGECSRCDQPEPTAPSEGQTEVLTGWRFVWTAVVVFLLPLGLAIAASAVAPGGYELLAALGGLLAGVLIAWSAARIFKQKNT